MDEVSLGRERCEDTTLEVRSWPESANGCEAVTCPVMTTREVTSLKMGL